MSMLESRQYSKSMPPACALVLKHCMGNTVRVLYVGKHDPECKNCKYNCTDEIFPMSMVQQKAIRGMQNRNNKAKAETQLRTGSQALGSIIQSSMEDVLRQCSGKPPNKRDGITMLANAVSNKQFNSEQEMYEVQKMIGVPTTKLHNGEDVRDVLHRGNKKMYMNNLR